ncbi:MAG: hypothetical protein KGI45_02855 [Patescibacteria group bacterium]|nr:hypothetical protein [Patescibacteria group bacterium]MDE1966986.1 hypothetical protein [Patescibacteria group bacterium]
MTKNRVSSSFLEWVGWFGLVVLLFSYALITLGTWNADNTLYQLCNLVGSLAIAWIAFKKNDAQPAILNFAWAGIALFALIGLFK